MSDQTTTALPFQKHPFDEQGKVLVNKEWYLALLNLAKVVNGGGIPGPQGVAGAAGPSVYIDPPEADEPLIVPGPPGLQGAPGGIGPAGPAVYLEAPEADEPLVIPGPAGPIGLTGLTGAQGPAGPAVFLDAAEADEPIVIPPRLSPGGWFDEKGSGGTYGFASGVDFIGGTTTTLALSQPYGSQANLIVSFDGAYQGADQFSLSGKTLTFTSAIPSGTQKVYVKGFLMLN